MSHQRYPSESAKEPHSISLKVLRLSRPSLVTQYPIAPPLSPPSTKAEPIRGSLAYSSDAGTNPSPFLLSPVLNLPVSFGSAYVGETFSCTLCANNDLADDAGRRVRDVRIEAEMKTPRLGSTAQKLEFTTAPNPTGPDVPAASAAAAGGGGGGGGDAVDLEAGDTLQRIMSFDLKEEGNHVLAVTVSYYEATETSGRTRTFRKLYQFICKASLIVRTKIGPLPEVDDDPAATVKSSSSRKRWALEAQLENCSEDVMQLEKVTMDLDPGLAWHDCNWDGAFAGGGDNGRAGRKPVLHPGEVEQVLFVVEEARGDERPRPAADGRLGFGVLGIGWRGEMGNRGYLSTGRLGTRVA